MTRNGVPPAGPARAWVDGVGVSPKIIETVTSGLREHGVEAGQSSGDRNAPAHGVLVFQHLSPDVFRRLAQLTAHGSPRVLAAALAPVPGADDGWQLLRAGAADMITWTGSDAVAGQVADRLSRWQRIDELTSCRHVREHLVGTDPAWHAVLRDAAEVAHFTDAAVLVTGESGTGKEGVAQLIHELDARTPKARLVVLDCSTVIPSLAGSEFFGHEKGAFTGASGAREGAFELADGGTLFLDEVGELPTNLQAELLRVIQEGTFKRVGSNLWRRSTFRLVCATNRDVAADKARGTFRDDFFYRIAGCTLHLPSLRDRRADVVPLFEHFFRQAKPGCPVPPLDDAVRRLLVKRDYPGNIRDLRSLVQRIAQRHVGDGPITVGDIPERDRPVSTAADGYAPGPSALPLTFAMDPEHQEIGSPHADAGVN